jgi:pSer/pThr/pTyr-binding forkhead associated (FHA) protein
VSRHHAVALQTAGGTVIEDLNSTNGIYVNGHRSSRRQLAEGDVVTIGKASFRYLVKPADDAANS